MGKNQDGSNWPAAVVALGFLAFVGSVFMAVYLRDGMDGATKAWALIGTVVGVITGGIPSYFFHNAAVNAQKDAQAAALTLPNDEATLLRFKEVRSTL